MSDIIVRLGNTAPTNSVRKPASAEEAQAAGPLGAKDVHADGSETFTVLAQEPVPGLDASITTCVIPDGSSVVDAVKDIGLAFTRQHSLNAPEWVHSADTTVARLVASHFSSIHRVAVPVLTDSDVEALMGGAEAQAAAATPHEPAVETPAVDGGPSPQTLPPIAGGAIQAAGRDLWSAALADITSDTGTSGTAGNAPTATTLTDTTKAWTTNQWAGHTVTTGGVIGVVLSNTATVLTIDRWATPGSLGGGAAGTPAGGATYVVTPGNQPATWIALTANTSTPSTGGSDTTLTGEITTAGGGLIRASAVYAHTAGTNTYTLTKTFTANGSDTLPVTIAKIGVFQGQNGGRLLFETLLSTTATLSASGDNVQITETVTGT